jgi:hypothetical protein
MATKEFPNPKRPHSLKRIVEKIIADPEYARFIHREVRKARGGDRAAATRVMAHFKPLGSELKALKIPASRMKTVVACTCTRTNLIDFAACV